MLFNSLQFLLFFPIVVLLYFAFPLRVRNYWLLAASYFFYMCWNPKYVILLLGVTIVTYVGGLLLDKTEHMNWPAVKKTGIKKWLVAGVLLINLGTLFYFKYVGFSLDLLCRLLAVLHIDLSVPAVDILLPVGISFFTFQALSYLLDVYRGDIYAEKNLFRYALFVSFFPQLVAGPIERSKNLLRQLAKPGVFRYDNVHDGLLLMLWGGVFKGSHCRPLRSAG